MKYQLFISFYNGLLHNVIYNNLDDVFESVIQLSDEENLNAKKGKIPIQPYPVFGV